MKKIIIIIFIALLSNKSFSQYKIVIISGSNPLCLGNSVKLQLQGASGIIVPAIWYLGSCNGALIGGSDSYDGFTVNPAVTTTYFAIYTHCESQGKQCSCAIRASYTVQVIPKPGVPNQPTGNTNICKNTVTTVYHTTVTSGLVSDLIWQITPANATLTNKRDFSNGTDTVFWNPAFSGTAQISVRSNNSACGYSTYSTPLNVTIQSTAPATPIAGNNSPVCLGNTLTLSSSTISGATYYWSGPNGFSSTSQNPTVSSNATTAMGGIYNVSATINSCSSQVGSTTVVINQATAGNNGPVCTGSTLSLSASTIPGATYYWSGPNGFSSTSQNPTVSTNTTSGMAGIYSVYTTANGCTSPSPGTTTVVVKPIPTAPTAENNGPVCVGNTLSVTTSTVTGATYSWTGPNSFMSTLQTPTVSASATTAIGGVYSVIATVSGCASVAGTTTVEINKITASNNGPVCVGNTLSLSTTTVSGATYAWTGPNSFSSSQQNPTVNTSATSVMGGVYSVTSTVNGCTSTSSVTIVTINPAVTLPTVISPITYCQNAMVSQLTATGTGLKWYTTSTGGTGISTAPVPSALTAGTTIYYVSQTVGCESQKAGISVIINPLPASASIISGMSSVCQGQNSLTYTVPAIANATSYIWTLPGAATGTSTTNSIAVSYGISAVSGNITVKGNNMCGNGATSILAITVNNKPTTPIISLNGYVLHSNAPTGNQWFDKTSLINGALNQDYTVSVNGDYHVIVTHLGCSSDASNISNVILTGIELDENNKIIKVYPNPVSNELIMETDGKYGRLYFEILNEIGKVVFKGNLVEKTIVQTSNFAPGVYLIKLTNGKMFEFKKIIKD